MDCEDREYFGGEFGFNVTIIALDRSYLSHRLHDQELWQGGSWYIDGCRMLGVSADTAILSRTPENIFRDKTRLTIYVTTTLLHDAMS